MTFTVRKTEMETLGIQDVQGRAPEGSDGRDTHVPADDYTPLMAHLRRQGEALGAVPVKTRAQAVDAIITHVCRHQKAIVRQIQVETGKTATDALVSEVLGTLDTLHWLRNNAPRLLKDHRVRTPLLLMGKKSCIWHEPVGVGLVIAPWNYPFHIALTNVVAALVAGNAVVLKPSEWTPLTGVMEAAVGASELFAPAFEVVYGNGATGQTLIEAGPDRVCFTGSIRTGRAIMEQCANAGIPVELELGGKDAALVTEDVNLERTVRGVLWGALTNAGQSCTSIEQLWVQESVFEPFMKRLCQHAEGLIVNRDRAGEADMGWMTTSFQADRVRQHWDEAVAKGGRVWLPLRTLPEQPQVLLPGVIEVTDPQCKLWQEETFGPVIAVRRYTDDMKVVGEINALPYGLSASIWCRDTRRASQLARRLRVGAVSINNVMLTEGHPGLPFGGCKASGFGKVKGEDGLLAWAHRKAVMIDGQKAMTEPNWFPYAPDKYRAFEQLILALFGARGWRKAWGLIKAALALDKSVRKDT
ncbi:MAG: aldehyde dehydrogenase family protein [Gammaproteobacteria bacterium]|nr:MAG: aldehyde dehydrogenase family protein [Gammaproteobacteria bacterium]